MITSHLVRKGASMFAIEATVMREYFNNLSDITESNEMDTSIDILMGDDNLSEDDDEMEVL